MSLYFCFGWNCLLLFVLFSRLPGPYGSVGMVVHGNLNIKITISYHVSGSRSATGAGNAGIDHCRDPAQLVYAKNPAGVIRFWDRQYRYWFSLCLLDKKIIPAAHENRCSCRTSLSGPFFCAGVISVSKGRGREGLPDLRTSPARRPYCVTTTLSNRTSRSWSDRDDGSVQENWLSRLTWPPAASVPRYTVFQQIIRPL